MKMSLIKLFCQLYKDESYCTGGDLFGFDMEAASPQYEQADMQLIANFYSREFCPSLLPEPARNFCELSVDAFDAFIHAWMSEQIIEAQILRFGRRVIAAAEVESEPEAKRLAAEKAAADRGDADTLAVLSMVYKVHFESHRMLGFLRFVPDANGVYIARCAPDHFVLPGLGEHFTARFGETGWAIFDEKRGLCLCRLPGESGLQPYAKIVTHDEYLAVSSADNGANASGDEWEDLWKHYHTTINNESRKNPGLQRQFMPKRYWKYLPEAPVQKP